MLEACLTPEVAAEITMQPVRRHKVDAAIFFSDIVIPLKLAGLAVEIRSGVGPIIANPVRTRKDLESLRLLQPEELEPITRAVELLVSELGPTPLIGFGGAPFTLASYLIEGGPSKDLPETRKMMRDPELFQAVLFWCADVTASFIRAQVVAGASALQVFDSWAGKLTPEEYRDHAKSASRRLFAQLEDLRDESSNSVPRVHFGLGADAILEDTLEVGATAIGVDHTSSLSEVGRRLPGVALQGNLDPEVLSSSWDDIEHAVGSVLDSAKNLAGHVFNLGHGVPKQTDPEVLTKIVQLIHQGKR